MGFFRSLLEKSGPAEESNQDSTVRYQKAEEPCRGYVIRVEKTALFVADPVCLDPPAQQGGTPREKQKWPPQAKRHNDHTDPQHGRFKNFATAPGCKPQAA